jgi:regulatory protein
MDTSLYESLLRSVYRFVSFRPRSEREIRDFLKKKLIQWKVAGSASVVKAIEKMRDLGYVDDQKFALWWITQRNTFRPKGKLVIRQELLRKGIERDVVDEAMRLADKESGGEEKLAQKTIAKKLVLWAKLPRIEQKKKVYTFLAQRGFSSNVIDVVIDAEVKKD